MSLVATEPQPALAWSFESSNVDYVTNLVPTTTLGTPTYVSGKYGQAINFPNSTGTGGSMATNYSIYTVSLNSSTGYTFAFWVNFNIGGIFAQVILSLANSSGVRIVNIYLNNANQIVSYDNGSNLTVTSPTLNTGTWYHVAISITTSSRVLYLNGVGTSGTSTVTGTQTAFILGGDLPSQGSFSAWCSYDDLRIYNTALTATQVQSVYAQQGMPGRGIAQTLPANTLKLPTYISSNVSGTNITGSTLQPFTPFGNGSVYLNTDPTTYITWSAVTLAASTNFTLETWANYSDFTGVSSPWNGPGKVPCLFNDVATGSLARFYFGATIAGTVGLYYWNNSQDIYAESAITIAVNTWNHLALTYDGTTYRIFINGVLAATNVSSGAGMQIPNGLRIGSHKFTTQSPNANVRAYITSSRFVTGAIVYPTSSTTIGTSIFTPPTAPLTTYSSGTTTMLLNVPVAPLSLTGVPLFSQLSAAAASSAVGAFSLRAINGVSTRAVAVIKGTLDYSSPPLTVAFTGSAARSSVLSNVTEASMYFPGTVGSYLSFTNSRFLTSFKTSKMTFEAWVNYPNFTNGYYASYNLPTSFGVMKPDGSQASWTFGPNTTGYLVFYYWNGSFQAVISTTNPLNTNTWYHIAAQSDGTNIYIYLNGVLVTQAAISGTPDNTLGMFTVGQYNIYGQGYVSNFYVGDVRLVYGGNPYATAGFTAPSAPLTPYTTGGATTALLLQTPSLSQDFYADERGNLLTAPVVGQSVASWLGSATGYVTTWYDQSGSGNHMAQVTAANQPVLTTSTTPASLIFSGSEYFQNTVPFTFNFGSGAFTTRYVVSNNTGGLVLYKAASKDFIWYPYEKKFWLGDGTTSEGSRGGYPSQVGNSEDYILNASAIGATKTSIVHKATSTTTVPIYVNGTLQTLARNTLSMKNDPGSFLFFGKGSAASNYIGNLHEIQIFSTAFSDADRLVLEN